MAAYQTGLVSDGVIGGAADGQSGACELGNPAHPSPRGEATGKPKVSLRALRKEIGCGEDEFHCGA